MVFGSRFFGYTDPNLLTKPPKGEVSVSKGAVSGQFSQALFLGVGWGGGRSVKKSFSV